MGKKNNAQKWIRFLVYHYKYTLFAGRQLLELCQCFITFSNFSKYCILKRATSVYCKHHKILVNGLQRYYIALIVTKPFHQDEEHLQVVLKMRMNHCLDHHTCENKFAYVRSFNKFKPRECFQKFASKIIMRTVTQLTTSTIIC